MVKRGREKSHRSKSSLIREAVESLVAAGLPVPPCRELARKYECSHTLVSFACKGLSTGWKNRGPAGRRTCSKSYLIRQEVESLVAAGLPVPTCLKLAIKYECSSSLVSYACIGLDTRRGKGSAKSLIGPKKALIRGDVQGYIYQGKEVPSCTWLAFEYGVSRELVSKACKGLETGWKPRGRGKKKEGSAEGG